MYHSPLKANSLSASQEGTRLSCNPKLHCRIHKTQSLVPILSQMYPVSLRSRLIFSSHLCLGFPSGLLYSGFPTKILYEFFNFTLRLTWSTHVILVHIFTVILSVEACKLPKSSSCCLLHPPATSSHLVRNILLSILISCNISLCSSLATTDQVSHTYKAKVKLYFFIF